tara:strand:- start:1893 stop:2480 length:588 start_codon:yes stop_codon:yes gene_type:complete
MPLSKIQSESMNLADTYAFTGTVSGAGGGKLLQTVITTVRTYWDQSISGTSWTDVNDGNGVFQVQITPTATDSKILLSLNWGMISPHNSGDGAYGGACKIVRNGSDFDVGNAKSSNPRSLMSVAREYFSGYVDAKSMIAIDDSHNSTSQLTYKVQVMGHTSGSTYTYRFNHNGASHASGYASTHVSRLIAQEIAS